MLTALPLLLDTLFGRVSEGQKLEKVKDALRSQALPRIEQQLRPEIGLFLDQAHQHTLKLVADSFEEQIKQQKEALSQATKEMGADGKDKLIAAIQGAQSDLNALAQAHQL